MALTGAIASYFDATCSPVTSIRATMPAPQKICC
jgi:hypothetical protein